MNNTTRAASNNAAGRTAARGPQVADVWVRVRKRKIIEIKDKVRKFSMVKVIHVLWLVVGT